MEKLKISKSARILVLAPHPDDESIGCGGLLLKYHDQCDVVVLTDGRHGGLSGQDEINTMVRRKLEFEKAMAYIGIEEKHYCLLGVEDGKLSENFVKFSSLDVNGYDVIFCPAPGDKHSDHYCVYDFLTRLSLKPQVKIFGYEVWSTINPSHYINISDVVDEKKKLIGYYESQLMQVDYDSRIISLNHFRGMLVYPCIPYAEAYQEM